MRNITSHNLAKQQGAALAVGLILLLIITLMGYTGMKGTMLQEKMAAGLHNRSLANAGANSALRSGEDYLYNLVENTNGVIPEGTPNGILQGIYSRLTDTSDPSSALNPILVNFKKRNWTHSNGVAHAYDFTSVNNNGALYQSPEYIIEEIAGISGGGTGLGTQIWGTVTGGASGGSAGANLRNYLITGKSMSGDGKTISVVQSTYTVVPSSSATN
jgi:Tfp pilus assembly protein PilX